MDLQNFKHKYHLKTKYMKVVNSNPCYIKYELSLTYTLKHTE